MRVGSLFSGIGGLDLGLERAGMSVIWQVESDPYCNLVLQEHWPAVPKYGQIEGIDWSGFEKAELVCGGFPCQDLSKARRSSSGGLSGSRSGLWREFLACVEIVRPSFVLMENIHHGWRDWVPALRRELGGVGYFSIPLQLSAAEVGADHIRRRAFILAHTDGELLRKFARRWCRENREIETEPLDARWRSAESRVARVDDGLPDRVDRNRALGNAVVPQVAEHIGRQILEGRS